MTSNRFIEPLHRRTLLAAYTINGTASSDQIEVNITATTIFADVNGTAIIVPVAPYDGVVIQAGDGSDVIDITANTRRVSVVGGEGDDVTRVAFTPGTLNNISAGLSIDGGIGIDSVLTFDDFNFGPGRTYILNSANWLDWGTGVQIQNTNVDIVEVNASQSDDTLYADASPTSAKFRLKGGNGVDRLLLTLVPSALAISESVAITAIEDVYFDDSTNTFSDTYTLTGTGLGRTAWGGLQFVTGPRSLEITTGSGSETFNVQSLPASISFPPHINTGPGADQIYVKPLSGAISIDGNAGDDSIFANSLGEPGSLAINVTAGDFASMVIGANVTLTLVGTDAAWSRAYNLSIEPNGRLNLSRTSLILDLPSLGDPLWARVDGWLASGYAGGTWLGYGIGGHSTTASGRPTGVGSGPSTLFSSSFPAVVGGYTVDLSTLILRHTLVGDTNLDRAVNFDDLLTLAQNYGTNTLPFWFRGDFDYDGDTDFDNLLSQAQNYSATYAQSRARTKDGRASLFS